MSSPSFSMVFDHAVGVQSKVQSNVFFLDDTKIIYPVGRHLVVHDLATNRQQFIPSDPDVKQILALSLSYNKRFLAVSEKMNHGSGQITIVNLQRMQRMHAVSTPGTNEFLYVDFSHDGRYIAAQGGPPEYSVVYWLWDRHKILANMPLMTRIERVLVSPYDSNTILTLGPRYVRVWHLTQGELKGISPVIPRSLQVDERALYTDVVWIQADMFCVSTDRGQLLLFHEEELVNVIRAVFPSAIWSLASHPKGIIAAGPGNSLAVFERTITKEKLSRVKTVKGRTASSHDENVTYMSSSPSGDAIICTLTSGQIMLVKLKGDRIGNDDLKATTGSNAGDSDDQWILLSSGFHAGPITGLDVCLRKPLVISCGHDHSVRVWNFFTHECTNVKHFREEPMSVALHPSGFHALIALADRVTMFDILVDDFLEAYSFPIRACKGLRFSHGGHLFAAFGATSITIGETYTRRILHTIEGHIRTIRSIAFSKNDATLASTGVDGAIYLWDTLTGQRRAEFVDKSVQFTHIEFLSENTVTVASNDRMVKIIRDEKIVREFNLGTEIPNKLVALSDARHIIAGTRDGLLKLISEVGELEFLAHSGPILQMILSLDDAVLVTAGQDGVLCFFRLTSGVENPPNQFSDLVLATSSYLEEKNSRLLSMELRLAEVNANAEHQLHAVKNMFEKQIEDIMAAETKRKDLAARNYDELQTGMEATKLSLNQKMKENDLTHLEELENLTTMYEEKIAEQEQALLAARQSYADIEAQHEEGIRDLQMSHVDALTRMRTEYQNTLQNQLAAFDQLVKEMETRELEHAEILRQVDSDHDDEAVQQMSNALEEQRKTNSTVMNLKSDAQYMRLRFKDVTRERDHLRQESADVHANQRELEGAMNDLMRKMDFQKRELMARDETIASKERLVTEARQANKELETFKFVLQHKNEQLEKDLQPQRDRISQLGEQLDYVDDQVQSKNKEMESLVLTGKEKDRKIAVLKRELGQAKHQLRDQDRLMQAFEKDVDDLYTRTDASEWRNGVRSLYKRYVSRDAKVVVASEDEAHGEEFARQRAFMEQSLERMKGERRIAVSTLRKGQVQRLQENQDLIDEVNELRRERKHLMEEVSRLRARLLKS